jgi:hypothetical protein
MGSALTWSRPDLLRWFSLTPPEYPGGFFLSDPGAAASVRAPPSRSTFKKMSVDDRRCPLIEQLSQQLQDEKARRKLQRLDKRLFTVVLDLDRFATAEK